MTFRKATQVQVPGVVDQIDVVRTIIVDALKTDTLAMRSHIDFCKIPRGLFLHEMNYDVSAVR
jgi:hypothetical protein